MRKLQSIIYIWFNLCLLEQNIKVSWAHVLTTDAVWPEVENSSLLKRGNDTCQTHRTHSMTGSLIHFLSNNLTIKILTLSRHTVYKHIYTVVCVMCFTVEAAPNWHVSDWAFITPSPVTSEPAHLWSLLLPLSQTTLKRVDAIRITRSSEINIVY